MKFTINGKKVTNPLVQALMILLAIPLVLLVGAIVAVVVIIIIPIVLIIALIAVLLAALGYSQSMPEVFEKTKRSFNRGRKAGKK